MGKSRLIPTLFYQRIYLKTLLILLTIVGNQAFGQSSLLINDEDNNPVLVTTDINDAQRNQKALISFLHTYDSKIDIA